jgi:hypothetical protein
LLDSLGSLTAFQDALRANQELAALPLVHQRELTLEPGNIESVREPLKNSIGRGLPMSRMPIKSIARFSNLGIAFGCEDSMF